MSNNQPAKSPQPLTTADARAQGIPRQVLRSRFQPIFRGVHTYGRPPLTLALQCEAARLVLPTSYAFSHLTAVQLLGLPTPYGFSKRPPLYVTIPLRANRVRRPGMWVRRSDLATDEIMEIGGLPITIPERIFVDVAQHFDDTYLVPLGDAMLRRGLVSCASLAAAIDNAVGRRGVGAARLALPRLDGRSKSPSESLLRVRIEDAGMPRLTPNVEVFDELGCFIAVADLLAEAARVVIEYESARHREKRQFSRDIARDQLYNRAGYAVLRASDRDLSPHATLFYDTLRQMLADRTPQPRG